MWPFSRTETKEEIVDRLFNLTDKKDYGLCPSPMSAQTTVNELASHFLGENWYSTSIGNVEQINAEIVNIIEMQYPKQIKRKFSLF